MAPPGSQMWAWSLCVFLSWTPVDHVAADPQYMVAVPAILEAAEESRFCISFLEPKETMTVTVSLKSQELNTTLMQTVSKRDFHQCRDFQVPSVEKDQVIELEVEVQGHAFYSKGARKVMVKKFNPESFLQTDKPIYLPGQTVLFRVVSLDSALRPAALKYSIIELKDPNGVRIAQWLNQTTHSTILQLSHRLNSEAPEGSYQIRADADGKHVVHWFKVEKYVLPKFEVTIKSKQEVNINQDEFEAEVCAKYTYGQPVPGSATITVCRDLERYYFSYPRTLTLGDGPQAELVQPCDKQTKQTDRKGCATFSFAMSTFTRMDTKAVEDQLSTTATVEEEGTGVKLANQMRSSISYRLGGLSFVDTPTVFTAGSTVEGTIRGVHFNGTPIANTAVYLFEGHIWSARRLQNLTTDGNGAATFSISTAALTGDLSLQASVTPELQYIPYKTPYYESGAHMVALFQEPSLNSKIISTLEVKAKAGQLSCDKEEVFTIKYAVVGEKAGAVDLMYLVLSRGHILRQGSERFEIEGKRVMEGEVAFRMTVSADMAPGFQVVAYAILPSQAVVAHSADFNTDKCFRHSVSLEFSESSAVPGEQVSVRLEARPKALCGTSAVDRSVFIKEPGARLNADQIFGLLPSKRYVPYETRDSQECVPVRLRRSVLPVAEGKDDPFTVFQNNGLKMVTNLVIQIPACLSFKGRRYYSEGPRQYASAPVGGVGFTPQLDFLSGAGGVPDAAPIVSVRTFFPETWLFDLWETGESGKVETLLKVPDTITTWEADAFCLSSEGLGMAPPVTLTVFQPFFLELSLPYSIIRGEQFELKATVFSYLSTCIMLTVTAEESAHYKLEPLSGDRYASCLCSGERRSVSWKMVPSSLGAVEVSVAAEAVASEVSCNNDIVTMPERGRVDRVTRILRVKAEGTEVMEAFNWLLCPKGEELQEKSTITLPTNVILGSARGSVSVLGDIMGRALKNLDGLLRMPYGCGEQNMALLAPNIYILRYLEETQQLTAPVRRKALEFLRSGCQRQLNYRHLSGAYSTFGVGVGNTWLTAFVLRSFAKAAEFVYIDPAKMADTKQWLVGKQQESGCFQMVGSLFNNKMKGGVSDEITLTAYIAASLLEMNATADEETVKKSLSCLKTSAQEDGFPNVYTTALMAYAFTLAGDAQTRARLLSQLNMEAKREGGLLYWEQPGEDSKSLSVEISSYMLLTTLGAHPSAEDLGRANRIVRWLSTQQNYYGGFYSTQDTVVALQALALYSTLVFSPDGSTRVTVTSPGASSAFLVNKNNKLLYQEKELADIEGKHVLQASGSGCAAVQLSVFYNVPAPSEVKTLTLEVTESASCGSVAARATVNLKIKTGYTGHNNMSNMAILDIKFLSGFAVSREALDSLRGPKRYRVEDKSDSALVYIPEIQKGEVITHEVVLIQEHQVIGQKPAVIKLYDYYEPRTKAEKEYTYSCVSG